jgi:hypothetical protein
MWALLIENCQGDVREWSRGGWRELVQSARHLPQNGWSFHSLVKLPDLDEDGDGFVTLSAVLSKGRYEEGS